MINIATNNKPYAVDTSSSIQLLWGNGDTIELTGTKLWLQYNYFLKSPSQQMQILTTPWLATFAAAALINAFKKRYILLHLIKKLF